MNRSILSLVVALAAGVALQAQAASVRIVADDTFDSYVAGALAGASGGSGFAGAWTGSAGATLVAVDGSDSPMTGSALQFTTPNADNAASRALGETLSGNLLVSFQFQFNGGAIGNNDFLGLWFGNSTGPNIGLKSNCGTGGACTADLFARTTGVAGAFSRNISIGETVELLGYLEKTGGSSVYNRFSLWVDQGDVTAYGSLGAADAVFTGASSVSSFATIGFRTANLDGGTSADSLLVDNLRIAVVPAPGTLALAGAALLLMGAGLGRQRRR